VTYREFSSRFEFFSRRELSRRHTNPDRQHDEGDRLAMFVGDRGPYAA
jgi:hypothetical protein